MLKLKKLFVCMGLGFVFLLLSTKSASAATLYWAGADGANVSVASNWSTTNPSSCSTGVTPSGSAPGSLDTMNFDADCDNGATIDASFTGSVSVVAISSGYGGTINQSNPLTVSGTFTQDSGIYTGSASLTIGGSVTLNGGTLTLPNGADLNGTSATDALKITGGIFNAPSGTMTLARGLNISGTPTFNANGGTFIFDGGTATLNCNNVTFNLVQITHSNNAKTINSNCNLPLGNNPTVGTQIVGVSSGQVVLSGTLSGTGTLTTVSGGSPFILNSGAVLDGFSGLSVKGMTVSGVNLDLSSYNSFFSAGNTITLSSGSLILPNGADLNGSLSISGGTFTAPSGTMTLAGNFSVSGSPIINHNNGTIVFDGGNQTISGSTTFYSFSKIATSFSTLTFTSGTTQTFQGTFLVKGENYGISLVSSSPGSRWNIDAYGPRVLSSLSVSDSNNINSKVMFGTNISDGGNNIGWQFNQTVLPISFNLDTPSGNSYITSTRPIFRWKKATDNQNSSILKYSLFIDNGDGGDFSIDNILPEVLDVNGDPTSLEYDTYTLRDDGDYLNLSTKGSNYWPGNMGDGQLNGFGKKNWRIVAIDRAGNVREENVDFYLIDKLDPSLGYKPNIPVSEIWFPLQIRILNTNAGALSSYQSIPNTTFNLSTSKPMVTGIAFASSKISVLVTDTTVGKSSLYTTIVNSNSRFSLPITVDHTSTLDVWVNLDGMYNQLPTIKLVKVSSGN